MADKGRFIFRLAALCNWVVTAPALAAPAWASRLLGLEDFSDLWLLRIWAGMAFLFGCMFWEISNDLRGRRILIKYAWIEKSITATSITIAHTAGAAPDALFWLIVFTDWIWIPVFLFYDVLMRGGVVPRRPAAALQTVEASAHP